MAIYMSFFFAGPKRVFDAFAPLLDPKKGRVVNMGSGVGPAYVQGTFNGKPVGAATAAQRMTLIDPKARPQFTLPFADTAPPSRTPANRPQIDQCFFPR